MESRVNYIKIDDILHAKYNNLYLINNKLFYLTINKNIILKKVRTLGGPLLIPSNKNCEIYPTVMYFNTITDLNNYVKTLNFRIFSETTLFFSHFFQHNIAHGLFDSLYPIYLCYLRFFNDNKFEKLNLFIELLFIQG